jgi:hypothetical protein
MGFRLKGEKYEEIPLTEQGWRWSEVLGLYLGIHNQQLRYFFPKGELVPTPEEAEKIERQGAEQERQRAERLAQKLRELGVDPDTLQATNQVTQDNRWIPKRPIPTRAAFGWQDVNP